ncbi:hypothetical protein V8038_004479 [Vibrio parahaemolyticus]|uniref:hypothetical protein n=1 Tax=Vibrio parahaemolyticus TaxID=670 RepID=UPI001D8A9321|nr:hypothetical protein [Vibrio parahaemolyticus]
MGDSVSEFLERKLEDSVIDLFRKRVEKLARKFDKQVITSPLNGQDRELGADFFLSEMTKFSIFEFKYRENDIKTEVRKDLRKILCEKLQQDAVNKNLHKECHFIAWSTEEKNPNVEMNIYCNEVCNKSIFKKSNILDEMRVSDTRQSDIGFITEFLAGNKGLEYKVFFKYINWLLGVAGDTSGRFELLFEHPDENIIDSVPITSLSQLREWLIENKPKPTIKSSLTP